MQGRVLRFRLRLLRSPRAAYMPLSAVLGLIRLPTPLVLATGRVADATIRGVPTLPEARIGR